jgi:undecaprenyl pyrophosphate phosphatase UppP
MGLILTAILLGIVEGLTEFIPVSSTGHLILASELFGYDAAEWETFNVVIQLGAILAVVVQYWRTFWDEGMKLLRLEAEGLRFVRNLLLGFLPSAALGFALKGYIYDMLESPTIVAWALIAGGIAILAVERAVKPGEETGVADLPVRQALGVGLAQCLALVPGVSRSGATIMGALALGDRQARRTCRGRGRGVDRGRSRLRGGVRGRAHRHPRLRRLRFAPRVRAVRMVSHRDRPRGGGLAGEPLRHSRHTRIFAV